MRILLTSGASHLPPRGGSTRANLAWLEYLSRRGHVCRIVGGAPPLHSANSAERVRRELDEQGIEIQGKEAARVYRGIEIYSALKPDSQALLLKEQIAAFRPDWVLVSSEDLSHVLLKTARQTAPGRVVYLAHTPQFFPFGPASWNADSRAADAVAHAAGIIAIGHHMADYIRLHCGRNPEVIHPPIYGSGPFPMYGQSSGGFVTMINPCAVKGISIFLALADAFPFQPFAALPGWGTTEEDRAGLLARPNITLLPNVHDIDEVFRKTRLLLMPSLWLEGFGLVVVEAMLRGIPVISSDAGGLKEAKAGTRWILPVRPIERYESEFDDQGMPKAVIPEQNIEPWREALCALLEDPVEYDAEAARSRRAAETFVAGLDASHFENFLAGLSAPAEASAPLAADQLRPLSGDRRDLLLRRLRRRS